MLHADEVMWARWEKTFAPILMMRCSRKVATIRTDAPLDINLDDAQFPTFDPK